MPKKQKPFNETFIVMWCSEGLECVIPVDMTKMGDGANMLHKLEDSENEYAKNLNRQLWVLDARARANEHRHYEIYVVTTTDGIDQEEIEDMFEACPQVIVDTIRQKGRAIYANRANRAPVIL